MERVMVISILAVLLAGGLGYYSLFIAQPLNYSPPTTYAYEQPGSPGCENCEYIWDECELIREELNNAVKYQRDWQRAHDSTKEPFSGAIKELDDKWHQCLEDYSTCAKQEAKQQCDTTSGK